MLINFVYFVCWILKFNTYYSNYLSHKYNSHLLNIFTSNIYIFIFFIFLLLLLYFYVDYLIKKKLFKLYWIFFNVFALALLLISIPFYFNINLIYTKEITLIL